MKNRVNQPVQDATNLKALDFWIMSRRKLWGDRAMMLVLHDRKMREGICGLVSMVWSGPPGSYHAQLPQKKRGKKKEKWRDPSLTVVVRELLLADHLSWKRDQHADQRSRCTWLHSFTTLESTRYSHPYFAIVVNRNFSAYFHSSRCYSYMTEASAYLDWANVNLD